MNECTCTTTKIEIPNSKWNIFPYRTDDEWVHPWNVQLSVVVAVAFKKYLFGLKPNNWIFGWLRLYFNCSLINCIFRILFFLFFFFSKIKESSNCLKLTRFIGIRQKKKTCIKMIKQKKKKKCHISLSYVKM